MKMIAVLFAFVTVAFGVLAQTDTGTKAATSQSQRMKEISVDEAEKLIQQNKEIVVLDVRTPKEFATARISGAKNIDFYESDFAKRLAALDKTKSYLVHCASGGRSAKARDLMKNLKFESVYHLKDGFKAWEKAGKPVQR